MPAVSRAQQRWAGMCSHNPEHARGKCPSTEVAREFAHGPGGTTKGLPERKGKKK